jgi:hypothetical protein
MLSAIVMIATISLLALAPKPARALEAEWTFNTGAPMLSSPKFADIDGDGALDLVLTSYGTMPDPYGSGWVHVLDRDGNALPGWPFFTDYGPMPATACIGDIDGNPGMEILAGDWSRLHLLDAGGNELPGWPLYVGVNYTPALADVDGDGDLEMFVPSGNRIRALHHDGTELPGWPVYAPETIGAPAVGDLDGDGEVEIVAGTLTGPVGPDPFEIYVWELDGSVKAGFPKATSGVCKAPPAIGDIDCDGVYEIVIPAYDTSNNDYLYVWDAFGNPEPGWPRRAGRCRLSCPALVNLDDDDDLEIVIGGGRVPTPWRSMLFAFEPSGEAVPGFPIEIPAGSQINSAPIVIDLDGDPELLEIVVKVADYIFAYHSDGTLVDGFPYALPDLGYSGTTSPSPAMADMDGDERPELVVCSCYDRVDLITFPDPVDLSLAYWPTMKRDAYNSSFVGTDVAWVPPVVDGTGWLRPGALALLQNQPNPFRAGASTWIPVRLNGVRASSESAAPTCVEILDLQGRVVQRLVVGSAGDAVSGVAWNGRDRSGVPVAAGVYLYHLTGGRDSRALRMQVLR